MKQALAAGGIAFLLSGAVANAFAQAPAGNAEAARNKVSTCIGCHGIDGYKAAFPSVYHVPRIGRQNAGYIAAALRAYRTGERSHPTMRAIAASLSDQDIADLAAYYAGGGAAGGHR